MRRFTSPKTVACSAAAALATAILLVVALSGVAGPTSTFAGRPGEDAAMLKRKGVVDDRFGPDSSWSYWQRTRLLQPQSRPAGLSPFGEAFRAPRETREPRGMVATPLGFLDLKNPRLLDRVPPGLLRAASHTLPGRGGLGPGANLVQVDEAAIRDLGLAAIEGQLRSVARVVGTVPERAFVVRADDREAVDRLAALPFVEAAVPYHPAFKIDLALGRTPLIQASRARSRTLELMVASWPGAAPEEIEALRADLEGLLGEGAVADYAADGTVLVVRSPAERVAAIGRLDRVHRVQELPEIMGYNAEAPSLVMTGSYEETLGARPFHDIGLDGGGLDTNGDGMRINDGSDTVPPQIVAVTDNGLSLDSAQFAQTISFPDTIDFPVGERHRKVHAIQGVADAGGLTCDALLSGSGTHGNVVAGVIAGNPSAIGVFATKQILFDTPIVSGISMDGIARGARIIMQDAAPPTRCTFDELIEKGGSLTAGNLATRMREARDAGDNVHLHVMPFGVPNFDVSNTNPQNGTYPIEAAQLDTFLVNNRDYMVFVPVGSQGATPADTTRRIYPDLFNGTSADNDPNVPASPQIPPPATAKNIVSVGGHRGDMQTYAGTTNQEEVSVPWASRGPATLLSLRTAPIITSVAEDFAGLFGAPGVGGVAVFRSRDNDNLLPVEKELDELNFGTSYAAAYAGGAGALVRDYFAQGFYPTSSRTAANRMPNVSGALVKAALVASANFLEEIGTTFPTPSDQVLVSTRATDLGRVPAPGGEVQVGVLGNMEQGYGRVQISNVLPIPNWPPARPIGLPNTREHPAAGLLIFDDIGTGEPPIDNSARTVATYTFTVNSANTVALAGGGRGVSIGTLRVALAWPDPPSAADGGGLLINDLDLELESPGPDNNITTTADNVIYDGNIYVSGKGPRAGQWSRGRRPADPNLSDRRNPVEAIHLSSAPEDPDLGALPSQLVIGTWRALVKRGSGGAVAGSISLIDRTPPEDANGNHRLDAGEDADGDGLLDAGGQPFALVIAGPVLGSGTQSWGGTGHAFPASQVRLDKATYGCADDLRVEIFDPTPAVFDSAVTLTVRDLAGNVLDTERGFAFTETPAGSRGFRSAPVPVRLASPQAVANNGLLETDSGQFIVVDYADSPVAGQARGTVRCDPSLSAGFLDVLDQTDGPALFTGGCDRDQYPDAGELLTYTVAVINTSRADDYTEVTATLTPSGTGAPAVRVLDSPKPIGRLPGGQSTGVGFSLKIDAAALNALPVASRRVTLTLSLDSTLRSKLIGRQLFVFTHAMNADKEALHYSTDFPAGGREIRDLNRNLQVDQADLLDPFTHIQIPDEDVTFSTLFFSDGGVVRNTIGEDLNRNNILDAREDTNANGTLDRGILGSPAGPSAGDKVPFSFDTNDGGFHPLRHPSSEPGLATSLATWEHKTSGRCGFQSARPDGDPTALFQNAGAGIWHTGDGDAATPGATATGCDSYIMPTNGATPVRAEFLFDVLHSPIVAKVHQTPDSRGFPFTVEFQRLAVNLNHQTYDEYAGGSINLDTDIDTDDRNCLLCQVFYPRFGGLYYAIARLNTYYYGVDPLNRDNVKQRTFGPLVDPNNSVAASGVVSGDETGFSGFTTSANPSSSSPIPTAAPDLLPYPVPNAPLPGVCTGGSAAGSPCSATSPPCPGGGTCTLVQNTIVGPTRNLDMSLVNYQDGLVFLETGPGAFEPVGFFSPGIAGNRWQIGVGFFVIENGTQRNDYGLGVDDPVLEWDEVHPVDESQFVPPHTPACQRYGQPGQAAGQPCATLVVDRTNLYECDEAINVTVHDPKRAGAGTVTVQAASESDSTRITTGVISVNVPVKSFPLIETAPGSGLFQGTITVTGQFNNPGTLFLRPSSERTVTVYYIDPLCDGDADGQAGEATFDNLDGDLVATAADNCPQVYNPAQADSDSDGRGNFCDNCPGNANPDQLDSDADGAGDLCDFDDVDFDGVGNANDNCPDVYNPLQVPVSTQNPRGVACSQVVDRDGDGVQDKNDNCVRTSNPTQSNLDMDPLGDACDGDCAGAMRVTTLPTQGSCNRSSELLCNTNSECPTTGFCSETPTKVCDQDNDCPGGGTNTCPNPTPEVCVRSGITNTGACSATNDDGDVDKVRDDIDNCPVTYNPAIILNTDRQLDSDRDGLGDACDPVGSWDDDNSGVPDDIASYGLTVACKVLPLARLVVKGVQVGDVDGDRDGFPDSGEKAWIYLTVQNAGPIDLTNVTLNLNSADPDVACITGPSIFRALFRAGETLVLGQIGADRRAGTSDDSGDHFEVVTRPTMQSASGSDPAALDMVLTMTSVEALGTDTAVPVRIVADLDQPPGAVQTRIPGPDGNRGTSDDGLWLETFDTDRDGDLVITLDELPFGTPGVLNDTLGVWVGTASGGVGALAAVACGGYNVPPQDPGCVIDPDNDMAWHIHCPPGACPNANLFVTPGGGAMAYRGQNSLHWGHHLDALDRLADTTRFRSMAAFMTNPINLALFTEAGDLQLSFFHIASMMSNDDGVNVARDWAWDYGDVQIQIDTDVDPAIDNWGFWDRLVPFQNVYDHTVSAWSIFGTSLTYCQFTPTFTGTAPPAPRNVHETMCWPNRVWSNCGWQWDRSTTTGCEGPGLPGQTGNGNWVETRFDLSNFLSQRVRIRWIAESWEFDQTSSSYQEFGGVWENSLRDDGWWVDDISLTGAVDSQVTAVADTKTPRSGACPTTCDPAVQDRGTHAALTIRDNNADGLIERGEQIALDASASTLPGRCVGGVAQFRFLRDGVVAQDWTTNNTFLDAPLTDALYKLLVRCSADFQCTGTAGATAMARVYTGDGQDIALAVGLGSSGRSLLSWASRPQPSSVVGYDLFRGTLDGTPNSSLTGLSCLQFNIPQPGTVGSTISAEDTALPPPGRSFYYLVGHSSRAAGALDALGRRSNGTIRVAPVTCP